MIDRSTTKMKEVLSTCVYELKQPISTILEPDWDIRNSAEDENGLVARANSIKKDGFINPITCIRFGNKYKVIAGRRRLKAAKMIGLKEIPIYVKDDMDAELDHRRVALIENCHRKDMVNSERAHGFFEVYKMAGYKKEQVIGEKSIDNWFNGHNNGKQTGKNSIKLLWSFLNEVQKRMNYYMIPNS